MANKKRSKPTLGEAGKGGSNDDQTKGCYFVELDSSSPWKTAIAKAAPTEGRPCRKQRSKTHWSSLNAPWTLHFDRHGTEDFAIICDSNGHDLATSRFFWLPEDDDPIPPTLAGMRVMAYAPDLLKSLRQMVAYGLSFGRPAPGSEAGKRIAQARAVIAKATAK
jgi:hypothetical protein